MKLQYALAVLAGVAVGYVAASTLAQYQPYTFALAQGVTLAK